MTIVILAGGKSRRMGRDKLRLPLEGEALLERALRRWTEVFPRVLVSVAEPDRYPWLGDRRVPDLHPGQGPMAGLEAGLLQAGEPVFLTAADMPFSSPQAALRMAELCPEEAEACVLTDSEGRWEPLFGLYKPACLPAVQALLEAGRRSMMALLDRSRVESLRPRDLGELWDDRLLLNLNEPGDYEKLRLELGE
ncbi:MAG: molybdenum cofactor guanylyltransferase [Oscillospiraceae bacterium]|nr:molybdenum cofactor guanylyltransferase [Oscillospiraceae bacterium]